MRPSSLIISSSDSEFSGVGFSKLGAGGGGMSEGAEKDSVVEVCLGMNRVMCESVRGGPRGRVPPRLPNPEGCF